MNISSLPMPITNFYVNEGDCIRVKCFKRSYRINSFEEAVSLCRKCQITHFVGVVLLLVCSVFLGYVAHRTKLSEDFLNIFLYLYLALAAVLSWHPSDVLLYCLAIMHPETFRSCEKFKKIDRIQESDHQLYLNLLKRSRKGILLCFMFVPILAILFSLWIAFSAIQYVFFQDGFHSALAALKNEPPPTVYENLKYILSSSDDLVFFAAMIFAMVVGVTLLRTRIEILRYVFIGTELKLK